MPPRGELTGGWSAAASCTRRAAADCGGRPRQTLLFFFCTMRARAAPARGGARAGACSHARSRWRGGRATRAWPPPPRCAPDGSVAGGPPYPPARAAAGCAWRNADAATLDGVARCRAAPRCVPRRRLGCRSPRRWVPPCRARRRRAQSSAAALARGGAAPLRLHFPRQRPLRFPPRRWAAVHSWPGGVLVWTCVDRARGDAPRPRRGGRGGGGKGGNTPGRNVTASHLTHVRAFWGGAQVGRDGDTVPHTCLPLGGGGGEGAARFGCCDGGVRVVAGAPTLGLLFW